MKPPRLSSRRWVSPSYPVSLRGKRNKSPLWNLVSQRLRVGSPWHKKLTISDVQVSTSISGIRVDHIEEVFDRHSQKIRHLQDRVDRLSDKSKRERSDLTTESIAALREEVLTEIRTVSPS